MNVKDQNVRLDLISQFKVNRVDVAVTKPPPVLIACDAKNLIVADKIGTGLLNLMELVVNVNQVNSQT